MFTFSRIIFFSYAWHQMMKLKNYFSNVWVMKKSFGMRTTVFQDFFLSMCESEWDKNKRIPENLVKLNQKKNGEIFFLFVKVRVKKIFDRGATFFRRLCFLHVCSVMFFCFWKIISNHEVKREQFSGSQEKNIPHLPLRASVTHS